MCCVVSADLSQFNCFVIASRPRHDVFDVTEEGGTFTSQINSNIVLNIPAAAVSAQTKISLEVGLWDGRDITKALIFLVSTFK